ncbi:MAG: ABC transporter ATP-binding protein [Deltaproteobacteria bacterium]|nr:ABC transporter ATP-binding protein [Deltaproteobacteria bacterium]
MAQAIEVNGLSFHYAGAADDALSGVSLAMTEGAGVAILGANGSGKTTLLKVLASLLLPTRGEVRVLGYSTRTNARRVRSLIGFSPADERSHDWRLTARQNLELFAALFDLTGSRKRDRISYATESVGLTALLDRPVRALSQGERQRLTLARALLAESRVLLLDEPFRSLDAEASARFVSAIKAWQSESHGTLVVAGHSLDLMGALCPTAVSLSRGRVERIGPFRASTYAPGTDDA